MNTLSKEKGESMVTLGDLAILFRSKIRTILLVTAFLAVLAAFYALTRPVQYSAEATFRDKGLKSAEMGSSPFMQLLGGFTSSSSSSNDAISLMTSRSLISQVISKLGLQAGIHNSGVHLYKWQNISDNVAIEFAYLTNRKEPIATGRISSLVCRDVTFKREIPSSYQIVFVTSDRFQILDSSGAVIQDGLLGEPVLFDGDIKLTVIPSHDRFQPIEEGTTFNLSLEPMQSSYQSYTKSLKIEANKKDKALINLSFSFPDRLVASEFVNQLMAEYNHYLEEENDLFSKKQMNYLTQREENASNKVDTLLENHVASLATEFLKTGFADSDKEMEFLGTSQLKNKQRLITIDLEAKRLKNFQNKQTAYYDRYENSGNVESIVLILEKIRTLKQKRDILSLAQADLDVPQDTQSKFKGISLETAEEIYRDLSLKISELQSTMHQTDLLLNELRDPSFEITSLSSTLKDPFSQEMITRTTGLALAIKDTNNRSDREIARLGDDLTLQKESLKQHLDRSHQLSELEEKLLVDKLRAIQTSVIELIDRQIATLQNQLTDAVKIRMENLAQERTLVEEESSKLRLELSRLPNKWLSEHKLKQRLELNRRMMDEVARLIETKSISYHLDSIQSAPLDVAVAPILPKSSRVMLFALLGALLGFFGSCALLTLQALSNGIKASPLNLKLANQFVAGQLSAGCQGSTRETLVDSDLTTLRRLSSYLFLGNSNRSTILIEGNGSDYSQCVARLLAKQKRKVILIYLEFDTPSDLTQMPGLLDYLEGKASAPYINRGIDYDQIACGGISHYARELVCSARFSELLTKLRNDYQEIIAVTYAMPLSPEAESFIQIFDQAVITLSEETIQDLERYWTIASEKKVAFVFGQES